MSVLETRLSQHLGLRCDSLSLTDATSAVVAAASLLIGPLIITIIIFCPHRSIVDVGGGG
jgi:hypothetical protein